MKVNLVVVEFALNLGSDEDLDVCRKGKEIFILDKNFGDEDITRVILTKYVNWSMYRSAQVRVLSMETVAVDVNVDMLGLQKDFFPVSRSGRML